MFGLNGILDIIGAGTKLIEKLVPDPNARLAAQEEFKRTVMDKAGAIIQAEAQGNWYVSAWRPTLMYLLMAEIVWLSVIAPVFGLTDVTVGALKSIPADFYNLLMIGMGGYIAGRSLEKVVGKVAPFLGQKG